ncbi:hypothetical protein [Pendulispora albinea]|uniref:Uncharacterized protein n=1 Tax=Pendulispora albinea TaxID=2741071 RepID=A0ABZ2LUZ3_9BACT
MTNSRCVPVEVGAWLDDRGITSERELAQGALNLWGNSFPAEDLPPPGASFDLGAIAFRLTRHGHADHFRCARQLVSIPKGRYDWIYLLAAAERRTEDHVWLHFADGNLDREWLRVDDFWPETPPRFGPPGAEGLRCQALHYPRHVQKGHAPTLWRHRIPVTRESPLAALRFPDNPAIHVFAITAFLAALPDATEAP